MTTTNPKDPSIQLRFEQISRFIMQERQQQFVETMREPLGQAIETVVQEGSYDLVLNAEAVAFFNNSYDITALVTAKLNELAR